MKTCTGCKIEKDAAEYYKNKRRKDGLSSRCKRCDNIGNKDTRIKHPEKSTQHRKNYRSRLKNKYIEWKRDKSCVCCGENDECCFELHHLDGSTKENHPSRILQSKGWEAFLQEASKCVLVCANCHRRIHAGKITIAG